MNWKPTLRLLLKALPGPLDFSSATARLLSRLLKKCDNARASPRITAYWVQLPSELCAASPILSSYWRILSQILKTFVHSVRFVEHLVTSVVIVCFSRIFCNLRLSIALSDSCIGKNTTPLANFMQSQRYTHALYKIGAKWTHLNYLIMFLCLHSGTAIQF